MDTRPLDPHAGGTFPKYRNATVVGRRATLRLATAASVPGAGRTGPVVPCARWTTPSPGTGRSARRHLRARPTVVYNAPGGIGSDGRSGEIAGGADRVQAPDGE